MHREILASPYYCAMNARVHERAALFYADRAELGQTPGDCLAMTRLRAGALDKAEVWREAERAACARVMADRSRPE